MNDFATRQYHAVCRVTCGVLLGTFFFAHVAAASIIANFDAGSTSEEVDGHPGMAGDGWSAAWGSQTASGSSMVQTVKDTNPLTASSGNYLEIVSTNTRVLDPAQGGSDRTIVRRGYEDYGSVALDSQHTISFLFRIDSGLDDLYLGALFDASGNSTAAGTSSAYYIRHIGSTWYVYNGTSLVTTGVSIFEGDTYAFSLDLNPTDKEWTASVINLDYVANGRTGSSEYTSGALAFYGADYRGATPPDSVGGTPHWNMNMKTKDAEGDPTRTMTWSLDSVHIIPEPSTSALLMGMGFMFFLNRRRLRIGNSAHSC